MTPPNNNAYLSNSYYQFPWYYELSSYQDGDKRISIHGATHGLIADVYRQSARSDEEQWESIALLLTAAPQVLLKLTDSGRYSKEFASFLMETERLYDNEALALYVKDTNSISIRTMPNMHKFITDSKAKYIINKVKNLMHTDLSSFILLLGTDLIKEFYTTIGVWFLFIFLFILLGLIILSLDEPLSKDDGKYKKNEKDKEETTYYYIDDSHSNGTDGGADG